MSEASMASIARNLSSTFEEPSPFPARQNMHTDRRWTESFASEPFHSTPKSGVTPSGTMPSSISYPTLLSQHAHHGSPSPLGHQSVTTANHTHTASDRSPHSRAGTGGGGGVGMRNSSSGNHLNSSLSPHRLQSSPTTLLHSSPSPKKSYMSELENSTIQKQRRELQLLIRELQDRDRELNEMVASHQKQLLAWEQDRQKLLALETKCARYESELKNRSEYIKSLKTRLKVMTSQDQSKACALETMQQQLIKMSDGATAARQRAKDAEEENSKMKAALHGLSERNSYLEAREREMSAIIKLKDKDLLDASSHMGDLAARLKKLDVAHKEVKQQSHSEKKQVVDLKSQLNESMSELDKLKGDLLAQAGRGTEHRIEVGKLQEQLKGFQEELQLAGEREKRKDQLIELQRSKQERTDSELTSLRQAYERQQRELSLLQLNIDAQKERSRADESLKTSMENNSLYDSKRSTPIKAHHSSSLNSLNGGSPLIGSAGEGGIAVNNHSSADTEELLDAAQSEQMGMSPTSKLHRLLTESRQMVENLEQSTLPPYIASSSPRTDQDMPMRETSPPKSASYS